MANSAFTAALLRASADGFSGLAAAHLIERAPSLAQAADFEPWRAHLRNHLIELAAAVEDEAPERFSAHAAWSRDAFVARHTPLDAVRAALQQLREVLEESLPASAWSTLLPFLDVARTELERSAPPPSSALPITDVRGRLAANLVRALVACDERQAVQLVLDQVSAGRLSVRDALEHVLVPAQCEIGRLWHCGEIDVAEEHFASLVTRKLLARVLAHAPAIESNGRTVVVAATAGDAHDLGVQVVAAFFELNGWRSICLGADTPSDDLVRFVQRVDADLVALGATLEGQRRLTGTAIQALRALRPTQRVLVGGAAFAPAEETSADANALWRRVGADGYAGSPSAAVELGRKLIEL